MERGKTIYLKTMKGGYTNSKRRGSEDLQMPQSVTLYSGSRTCSISQSAKLSLKAVKLYIHQLIRHTHVQCKGSLKK